MDTADDQCRLMGSKETIPLLDLLKTPDTPIGGYSIGYSRGERKQKLAVPLSTSYVV